MKVYDLMPKNNYSCMFCHKEFESQNELTLFFFCSESHKFSFAFNIVNEVFKKADSQKKFAIVRRLVEVSLR